nr:SEC-C metal-binding domain-containing protein [uncultured Blautia sp.]
MFYQLKITRKGTKPPVWRRCVVAADVTFTKMAAMLEELVQYPAGSPYEIEFFQKKIQIRENGDGEAKNNFTLLNAADTETAELMDSGKWFTFRQYGADKEAPEYRVDIEKKEEGTAETPSVVKEVKAEDDPYWSEAPEKKASVAVETEVETAKATEAIAAVEAAVRVAQAADTEEVPAGSRRNPAVRDFLMSYRKEDLLSIAGELGLHCKGMDQEDIASEVAAEVLKPEVMKACFLVADDQEVQAFEAAVQRKCFHVTEDEWDTLQWLNDMGYLVSYSDDYAEVPAEVAAVYDEINTPEFQTLRSQVNWMRDCFVIVSYLYVSAPAKTVYEMFSQRKGFDIGYEKFIELYHTIPEKASVCQLVDDQIILKSALINNIYKDIERRQGGRKFYIPSVDEVMDYAKNGYPTRSASYQKLGSFLTDEMKVSDAVKDQTLFFIYKECSMEGRMSTIMENLSQKGLQFSDEQLEKFTKLMMDANNNTRMLEYRGFTPNEISGAVWPFATGRPHRAMPNSFVPTAMPMQPASTKKIYPNDPCPCGSGKKYKKCCGRR